MPRAPWQSLQIANRGFFAALLLAPPVYAQSSIDPAPPPSIATESPGGVDVSSGSFSWQANDLQIGGEGATGLRLVRSYDSGMPAVFAAHAGFGAQGWSHNWSIRISMSEMPEVQGLPDPLCPYNGAPAEEYCEDITKTYFHSVMLGGSSFKFMNGTTNGNGSNVGNFHPIEETGKGSSLVFSGDHGSGRFTFTARDGTTYRFHSMNAGLGPVLDFITHPDGTVEKVHYENGRRKLITNSRGYALLFEYATTPIGASALSRVCVLNAAHHPVSVNSNCSAAEQAVSFGYATTSVVHNRGGRGTLVHQRNALTRSSDALGQQTTYTYDDGGHVNCIIKPGANRCVIRNTFSECVLNPDYQPNTAGAVYDEMHLAEQVIEQHAASGEKFVYSFPPSLSCPDMTNVFLAKSGSSWFEDAQGARTNVEVYFGRPTQVTDPLGRISRQAWSGGGETLASAAGLLLEHSYPEGNRLTYTYDDRGNVTSTTTTAKSGSSQGVLRSQAAFASTCSNAVTCNKPSTLTDNLGRVTNLEYDPVHGGIRRQMLPAASSGTRSETRYNYAQRYAWLRSGTGYIQAPTPVWLLLSEEYCRSSAADAAGNCAAGAADEIVTVYEYEQGGTSRGSNLLLRGLAVTADGETRRTCYGYDAMGRRVSETRPQAGLASCL